MLNSSHHLVLNLNLVLILLKSSCLCDCAGLCFMGSTNVAGLELQQTKEFHGPVNSLIVRRLDSIWAPVTLVGISGSNSNYGNLLFVTWITKGGERWVSPIIHYLWSTLHFDLFFIIGLFKCGCILITERICSSCSLNSFSIFQNFHNLKTILYIYIASASSF